MKKSVQKRVTMMLAALATSTTIWAQVPNVIFSSYKETDLTEVNNSVCNIRFSRLLYAGWNTLCVPFDINAELFIEKFGATARLERPIACQQKGAEVALQFIDCTREGIKANQSYLVYLPSQKFININLKESLIRTGATETTLTDGQNRITFGGTYTLLAGDNLYGIPVKKNAEGLIESNLVATDTYAGFYPTRCYVKWRPSSTATSIVIEHTQNGTRASSFETTHINDFVAEDAQIDVFNLNGQKVASQVTASEAKQKLKSGIYVVNGVKVQLK